MTSRLIRNVFRPPYNLRHPVEPLLYGKHLVYSLTYYYYIRTGLYSGYIFLFSE